jgi:hypothetical protein
MSQNEEKEMESTPLSASSNWDNPSDEEIFQGMANYLFDLEYLGDRSDLIYDNDNWQDMAYEINGFFEDITNELEGMRKKINEISGTNDINSPYAYSMKYIIKFITEENVRDSKLIQKWKELSYMKNTIETLKAKIEGRNQALRFMCIWFKIGKWRDR